MLNLVGITYYGSISKCERLLPFLFKKKKRKKKTYVTKKRSPASTQSPRACTAKHGRAYMLQACRWWTCLLATVYTRTHRYLMRFMHVPAVGPQCIQDLYARIHKLHTLNWCSDMVDSPCVTVVVSMLCTGKLTKYSYISTWFPCLQLVKRPHMTIYKFRSKPCQ